MANTPRSLYIPAPGHIQPSSRNLTADSGVDSVQQANPLALTEPEITGRTGPLPSPPAPDGVEVWGVNVAAAQENYPQHGLKVQVMPWEPMDIGDSLEILLDGISVTSETIDRNEVGQRVTMFIPSDRLVNGPQVVSYQVTRLNQNPELSAKTNIYVKLERPGGQDENGSNPGHSELTLDLPSEIIANGVGAEEAKAGVVVTIKSYPNMAEFDSIKLSWGGQFVYHEVKDPEVGKSIEIMVDEQTILKAGDTGEEKLAVTFIVDDLVQNRSEDWSTEKRVLVDTGNARLDPPLIDNTTDNVLDLDVLGDEDLTVMVVATTQAGFVKGDVINVKLTGTTTDGDALLWEAGSINVTNVPHIYDDAEVPNAIIRRLAKTQAVFSFVLVHADGTEVGSKGAFINVIGEPVRMAAPIALDEKQGALDPNLPSTHIEIPWDDSMAAGDQITLKWIGTYYNLGFYDPELDPHNISNNEAVSKKPIPITVAGKHLQQIEGGTLELYYILAKDLSGTIVERESVHAATLNVGEPRAELPAPDVTGIEEDGDVMDPGQIDTVLTVQPYSGMDIGDVVNIRWKGSISQPFEDYIKITTLTKGKPLHFSIGDEYVANNDGGTVEASYYVIRAVTNRRSDSDILAFSVGEGESENLASPSVPGSEDGTLTLDEIPGGATIIVPHWKDIGMKAGDAVDVTWQDDKGTTALTWHDDISDREIGTDRHFTAALADVRNNIGATVTVTYVVTFIDGRIQSSNPCVFTVADAVTPTLPAPTIQEAIGSTLDPNNALSGAHVVISTEANLKTGDSVTLNWVGEPGDGSVSPITPVETDGALQIEIEYATVKANDGHSVELSYTITRANQTSEGPSPSAIYDVKSTISAGKLKVMGARFNRSNYRSSATPRWISAFDANTGLPLSANWQYDGDTIWTTATAWRDTRCDLPLRVQTSDDLVTLNPANIIGNGNDTTVTGDAAQVAHRDTGDVFGWGNADYGGKIPSTIITLDDIVEVSCTRSAYAARRLNGNVAVWGNVLEGGKNVPPGIFTDVASNSVAFAGILTTGKVVAWGEAKSGATVPEDIAGLTNITSVVGAGTAFAAITSENKVVAWGNSLAGGVVPEDITGLSDIVELSGNFTAFAAMRARGRVVAWGDALNGGAVPGDIAALTDIAELGSSTARAFSLIRTTGQVVVWGDAAYGGTIEDPDIVNLTDIKEVSATWQAYAARRANGHVVAWGPKTHGGEVPTNIAALDNIVQVVGNSKAFAALCRDGTVVAWGDITVGGDTASVVAELTDVRAVYANSQSFVALTSDLRVVTWGNAAGGGDSSAAQSSIRGKVSYLVTAASRGRALTARRLVEQFKATAKTRTALRAPGDWAAPQVAGAENGVLDPGEDPDRFITVTIPPGTLKWKDRVNLYIGANLFDWILVPANGPGAGIILDVPASEFFPFLGATVVVRYTVSPGGAAEEEPSADLELEISGGFEQDAALDLSALNYIVAESQLPTIIPDAARMTREAKWGSAPYTYRSSDEDIATVDTAGTVTARRNGTCNIESEDSTGTTQAFALTISGINMVHFLTGSTDWAGMQSVCSDAGVAAITLAQFKALWKQYSDNLPVSTHLGWLDYPFWTADLIGAGTYGIYDLSGSDVDGNASSAEQSLQYQVAGVSSTAGQLARCKQWQQLKQTR
ncbi:MAG TPA: hypothetical protein VGC62_12660 [Pseudomonas sp.]|uniref:hypothetical protein n=1 Tax=Pseudomonas sp. TaxID=306 RepID=UPI002EDA34B8